MPVERFPIEEGSILTFARSIGDPNPIYCNHEYAARSEFGTIIAPPTYVQASAHFDPDYPLRPKDGVPWIGSGRAADSPPEDGDLDRPRNALHAGQEFVFRRPVRAGDFLRSSATPGTRWKKQGRSGALVFSETIVEYRDIRGELVVTSKSISVVAAPRVSDAPAVGERNRTVHARSRGSEDNNLSGYHVGDFRDLVVVDGLTRTQIVQYAGASGDFNPLHTDEVYATQVAGFPSVFAHGMLTMGMTARVVTDWVGDGRLAYLQARFLTQVWPGDTLTARAEVKAVGLSEGEPIVEFGVSTRNQAGVLVLSGTAAAHAG